MHPETLNSQVNRLRVFNAVKTWMGDVGECPAAVDIADAVDLDTATICRHMRALRNAKGLPFPITPGRIRAGLKNQENGLKANATGTQKDVVYFFERNGAV